MNVRTGFVSNSSSASFIIDKNLISKSDLMKIISYLNSSACDYDYWDVEQEDTTVKGFTVIDNHYFRDWLVKNGLRDIVTFEDH